MEQTEKFTLETLTAEELELISGCGAEDWGCSESVAK